MIKKLLILPILGLVGLTSLSYADTVDGFTSDNNICVKSFSADSLSLWDDIVQPCGGDYSFEDGNNMYICISSSDTPYYLYVPGYNNGNYFSVNNSYSCFTAVMSDDVIDISSSDSSETDKSISGKYYLSKSPITSNYSDNGGDSSDNDGIITIPSNFVSGLNSLLTNFGSTIANWLPTIILLGLGIVAVFSLFRVVRNYSRKAFKG